jgi:hypothetical protein
MGGTVAIGLQGYAGSGNTELFALVGDVALSKLIFTAGARTGVPFLSGGNFNGASDIGLQLERIGVVQRMWHDFTYATPYIPDTTKWSRFATTLTGDIAFNQISYSGSEGGMDLSVMLTQDGGGGHTATWGSFFSFGSISSTPDGTAGKATLWQFVCHDASPNPTFYCVSRTVY